MTRRQERVASLIRRILAEELQRRIVDPRLERMTSITRVEMSPDLSVAKIFVSVMSTAARQKLSLQALRSAAGRLRHAVGEQFQARVVPELIFKLDDSLQRAAETNALIERSLADSPAKPPREDGGVDALADDVEGEDDDWDDDEEADGLVVEFDDETSEADGSAQSDDTEDDRQ
ncbi:MAG: 30S ribosome-binding factor RbfA [Phycisphaerae bacterium]|nr:30S ribosome-binding factor RbfA [Phycisphaerae bacterium]